MINIFACYDKGCFISFGSETTKNIRVNHQERHAFGNDHEIYLQ